MEACLAGDWNSAYDVCQFPDSTFLSRKNYVNAMTWKAKQDGTDGQETPEIKSFFMRRKQNLETGENKIYTVRYTLKGVSDSQEETLEIAAGDTVKWNFKEWYVVPKDSCVTDVEITVPADASFYLDGVQVGKKYLKETADNVSIYKIPYLFLGGHTIELTEKQKDPYREIVLVQDNSSMEFLPDLKLNDSTGKTIADRAVPAALRCLPEQRHQHRNHQHHREQRLHNRNQRIQPDEDRNQRDRCDRATNPFPPFLPENQNRDDHLENRIRRNAGEGNLGHGK